MLYIFSNSDDKSIHHIVCTDSDIRAGIIISRIYEREHISGEPIRVQFHNETSVQGCVYGTPKRYEAIKATDKSNDTFEEEVRAKVAELGKGEYKINLSKGEPVKGDDIKKHRNDVLRLTMLLTNRALDHVPDRIKEDMKLFVDELLNEGGFIYNLGIEIEDIDQIKNILRTVYGLT